MRLPQHRARRTWEAPGPFGPDTKTCRRFDVAVDRDWPDGKRPRAVARDRIAIICSGRPFVVPTMVTGGRASTSDQAAAGTVELDGDGLNGRPVDTSRSIVKGVAYPLRDIEEPVPSGESASSTELVRLFMSRCRT
jgi:hypothetical protein